MHRARAHGRAADARRTKRRTSRDRVVCVVGAAGAGKTTALRVLADGLPRERASRCSAPRRAAAPPTSSRPRPASAARPCTAPARRPARGRPAPRLRARRRRGRDGRDARARAALELVDEAEGKAVLVGDPQQLPAGRRRRPLPRPLRTARRDRPHREPPPARPVRTPTRSRSCASATPSRTSPTPPAAAASTSTTTPTAAKQRLLEDWWQAAQHDLGGTVMLAYRRDDVRDLNDAARTLMLRSRPARPRRARARRARVPRRRPRPLPPQRRTARRPQRHPRDRRRPRPDAALTLRTDAGALRTHHAATPPSTSSTATRSPATPPRARPSSAPSSCSATKARSGVGLRRVHPRPTETRLYVVRETLEGEQHGNLLTPPDPAGRLASALKQSAAEQLAAVQTHTGVSEATLRAQERCRRQREQALETAERRLSAAQEQLRNLGRLGRGRQRAELQAEISHQRTVVRLARTWLTELPPRQLKQRQARVRPVRLEPESRLHRVRDLGLEL